MDDENLEDVKIDDKPIEVTVKKEKETPSPSFDYDDYSPSDEEIMDIETEIAEQIKKRTKNG